MKNIRHIFFDLDHTLWDFDKNCLETLEELYGTHRLAALGLHMADFMDTYRTVNVEMWAQYNMGKISKEEIRNKRFENTFVRLGIDKRHVPDTLNDDFLKICPTKTNLLPYAIDTLSYLNRNYSLYILTNGFPETQVIKLNSAKIHSFFIEVINSESCGSLKPDRKIFEYALNTANAASCKDCLMIGDDLDADVGGALNAGFEAIYYNRYKVKHGKSLKYEIECLSELQKLL
jgi:putative hydrolase of the HAD superfamily